MYRSPLLVALLGLAWAAPGRADIIYTYTTEQSTYAAAPGDFVTVKFYLNETINPATGPAQSIIRNGDPALGGNGFYGLLGAGFYVSQTAGSGNAITGVAANTGPSNPGSISDGFTATGGAPSAAFTATQARLLESTGNTFGPVGTTANGASGQVYLGSITVQAGAAGSTTSYNLVSYKNAPSGGFGGSGVDGNTVAFASGSGADLDVSNDGGFTYTGAGLSSYSFSVSSTAAVPEPSSIMLCGIAGLAFGLLLWCRRQPKVPAVIGLGRAVGSQ